MLSSRPWGPFAVIAVLLVVPVLTDNYMQYVINLMVTYTILAIGMNFILGYSGLLAFAHVALMGIGAYTTGLLMARAGTPFYIAVPAGAGLATIVGLSIAIPSLRVSGLYLAMVTFAFAELVRWILIHWTDVTLGSQGVTIPPADLFGWQLRDDTTIYYLILAMALLLVGLAKLLLQSKLGRSFVAVRDCEIAAQCSGINVAFTKITSFVVSAFYAGMAGAMFALSVRFIAPQSFSLSQLILIFGIVVIGGASTLAGSIIGAILLTSLPELLRGAQAWQEMIYGLLLMLFVIFAPKGIAGYLLDHGWLKPEILVRGWRGLIRPVLHQSAGSDRQLVSKAASADRGKP